MSHKITIERDEYGLPRFTTEYKTTAQRKQEGKDRRNEFPRESHAQFEPGSDRTDPVSVIKTSSEDRWAHLVPIRYGRMSKSPFTFFRGSASLMALDIAMMPTADIRVQSCGDCHLLNFGLFATPERNLIFDINDFDETLPAPFEWDIKRLATSFSVAARDNKFSERECKLITRKCIQAYREAITKFASMKILDVWYARFDVDKFIAASPDAETKHRRQVIAQKARSNSAESIFPKITQVIAGRRSIMDQPPLIYHPPRETKIPERFISLFEVYRKSLSYERRGLLDRYHIMDMAVKVVGIGSVGTRCGVLLLVAEDNDILILQVKQAMASVLEPYAGKSEFKNHGERVVAGQRSMQSASDMLLGWAIGKKYHFYFRQLRDMKFSVDIEMMPPLQLSRYAEVCGWTLARAHARAGDAAMISGYIGKTDIFDRAIGTFARLYADQTERDYKVFIEAIKSGELKADTES
ncbi:MAG TPA: DUF2252 domain-containing protein [Methanoregulaceae archaeon]|nr:DUF2252 domain-containing protein [Methanoregulaceae archaeon]